MRMSIRRKSEHGQALILIALAVVGLLGLTALAVDGGHVFAQRRQAQNAADTAAFAAAIAKIKGTNFVQAGEDRASSNGFTQGGNATVTINNPPDSSAPPAYIGNNDYVQAIIEADIPTFFARIVGVTSIPIRVQAVAQSLPKRPEVVSPGNGIVGLGNGCQTGAIVTVGGNSMLTISGGGIFSNSQSNGGGTGSCYAFTFNGGATLTIAGMDLVGCVKDDDRPKIFFDPPTGTIDCSQSTIPYPMPAPDFNATCSNPGSVDSSGIASPGNYGDFPPAGTTTLLPGKYCISGNFKTSNSDHLTGDGVLFIVQKDVQWTGGTIHFTPITAAQDPDAANLLLYVPYKNGCDPASNPNRCHTVNVNAGTDAQWSGTIFAPDSNCVINGSSNNYTLHSQVICYSIFVNGTTGFIIEYNAGEEWTFPYPPQTELNR